MKSCIMSKLVMGAALITAVSLLLVLALIFVFVAELYCSMLRKRRRCIATNTASNAPLQPSQPLENQTAQAQARPPMALVYAQGVLRPPRSFLLPLKQEEPKKKKKSTRETDDPPPYCNANDLHFIGLVSSSPSLLPLASFSKTTTAAQEGTSGCFDDHFVCISNPIYDGVCGGESRACTPFETPDTSPSRLEMGDCWDDDDEDGENGCSSASPPLVLTPPLTPMKKLPVSACSVFLTDGRSLVASVSGTDSNNASSSSSLDSPCTSPSW